MTLFKRRRSRYDRAMRKARDLQERLPSTDALPDLPDLNLPDIDTSKLRDISAKRARKVKGRVSRDKSGDTPLLSLAGGLLLGLLVGIVVAVILISRSDNQDGVSARQTGITLLPAQDEGESGENEGATAIG